MRDKIIKQVIDKFKERSDVGYKKYGVTLHDDEPSLHKWLNHLQEELMDAVNYIQKLKMETSDALEEKILKDYEEEDSFSKYRSPERWTEDRTW
jgi:DNA anti-recombination protein RmuC